MAVDVRRSPHCHPSRVTSFAGQVSEGSKGQKEGRKDEKEGAQSTDSESARRAIKTVKRLMGLRNDADGTSRVMVCRNDGPVVRVRYDKMFSKVCEGTAWHKEVHEGGDWRGT